MSTTVLMTSGRILPGARSGADLVPGVPARVIDLAEQLEAMARGFRVADGLLQSSSAHGWQGIAAVACRRLVSSLSLPYARAARVIGTAAYAARSHAQVLAAAQRAADDALDLDLRAVAMMRTPGPPSAGVVPPALALAMQRRALVVVEQARSEVQASAAVLAESLCAAADAAPDEPNVLVRLVQGLIELQRELQLGVIESTVATVSAVALYSPNRLLTDPEGWGRDTSALVAGLDQLRRHPGQSAVALLDWDNFVHNPGRFFGHLGPDIALGLATGGTALVANRGVSVGVRAAAVVSRGQTRAEIRAAMSTARTTGRARLLARDLRGYRSAPNEFGHTYRLSPGQNLATSALARDARWAEHDLTARVRAAAAWIGVRPEGLEHAVKGRESLSRKVSEQLAKSGGGLEAVLPKVNDTVRYTFVAEPSSYVRKANETVTALNRQQMVLVDAQNFWGGPRYRGLNLTFADPRTGRLLEVQVHTPDSYQAGIDTHPAYERYRQVGIPLAEKDLLAEQIRAVYQQVASPPGVDRVEDALSRHSRAADATNRTPLLLSSHPLGTPAAIAGSVVSSSLPSGDDEPQRR